jgi:hypothetical protein
LLSFFFMTTRMMEENMDERGLGCTWMKIDDGREGRTLAWNDDAYDYDGWKLVSWQTRWSRGEDYEQMLVSSWMRRDGWWEWELGQGGKTNSCSWMRSVVIGRWMSAGTGETKHMDEDCSLANSVV